ncbi:YheC/YheD family protein [Paenibacillus harenae]|uniref:YheC/YheD family protein n=1 Tax=Paenibacillus harenae TaxID=306543 RepID=UPI0027944D9B|nr:YheC/YheD family protein [Paenibacillus harenae]MDQ0060773.1 glutathione synthase/RimK-type ligase-like ATP-grasp enzyme [Paenibacillus harenae]
MGVRRARHVTNKWAKTLALLSHPNLAPHIPLTKPFGASQLRSMLNTYWMVVVKPVTGSGGVGVMKVSRTQSGYAFTYLARTRYYANFESLLAAINKQRKGKPYLVQRGIFLAEVNGRPIDYRVKYVKKANKWKIKAFVGKIARQGLFVTNIRQGGTLISAAKGIAASFSDNLVEVKKSKMRELTIIATEILENRFPGVSRLGYDYGIDKQGKIWIFEVNTRPQ